MQNGDQTQKMFSSNNGVQKKADQEIAQKNWMTKDVGCKQNRNEIKRKQTLKNKKCELK